MPHENNAAAFASPPCTADVDGDPKQLIENLAESVHNLVHSAHHEPWYACEQQTCRNAQAVACQEALVELADNDPTCVHGGEPLLVEGRPVGWVLTHGPSSVAGRLNAHVRIPWSERGFLGAVELGFLEDVRLVQYEGSLSSPDRHHTEENTR